MNDIAVPVEAAPLLEPVAPGISLLRMTLPFALDHINLWVLEDGEGVVLVDTGMPTPETKARWEEAFRSVLAGKPVTRILITHVHPDHFGLSGWLAERTGAPVHMIASEWDRIRRLRELSDQAFGDGSAGFMRQHGLEAERAQRLGAKGNVLKVRMGDLVDTITSIDEGTGIVIGGRRWVVMLGRGHVEAHACLWCEEAGVLISGDQVLPRISPNVSVHWWQPEADPLTEFMASLDRFGGLPEETLVLPSHGRPFATLKERTAELASHHRDRLAAAEKACLEGERTAVEILPVLFRRGLDDHQIVFALGEAVAHLRWLETHGKVSARMVEGVIRYGAPDEAAI